MHSIRDIRLASVEALLKLATADGEAVSFDELWHDSATLLSPGCRKLGIKTVAEFGGLSQPSVPEELAIQLRGKVYQPGFEVEYEGKRCIVTYISINPEPLRTPEEMEAYLNSISDYSLAEGRLIPKDCRIDSLSLVSCEAIYEER